MDSRGVTSNNQLSTQVTTTYHVKILNNLGLLSDIVIGFSVTHPESEKINMIFRKIEELLKLIEHYFDTKEPHSLNQFINFNLDVQSPFRCEFSYKKVRYGISSPLLRGRDDGTQRVLVETPGFKHYYYE